MEIIRSIQNRIYELRGERVMLDRDLAFLYGVETKALNLAVKRNIGRFPADFMFQLTREEYESLRFQNETSNPPNPTQPLRFQIGSLDTDDSLRFQIETLKPGRGQHSKYLPYAFTEQGVAMLSGVLHSEKAINMNIAIMRAFVEVRRALLQPSDTRLKELWDRLNEHDVQLSQIYDAMENLLDEKAAQKKWDQRERIGFKKR